MTDRSDTIAPTPTAMHTKKKHQPFPGRSRLPKAMRRTNRISDLHAIRDLAVAQGRRARRHRSDLGDLGDDDQRRAALLIDQKQLDDVMPRLRIEVPVGSSASR